MKADSNTANRLAIENATGRVPALLDRFQAVYASLDSRSLHLLDEVYCEEIVFEDPFTRIEGRDALHAHFESMYANVASCRFDFEDVLASGGRACIQWRMRFRHPRLGRGAEIAVPGVSILRFGERVQYHRDYFDAGAMLYENVPLLGRVVRHLRARVART
jgi:limonene-1,2-epoxide hydrolase